MAFNGTVFNPRLVSTVHSVAVQLRRYPRASVKPFSMRRRTTTRVPSGAVLMKRTGSSMSLPYGRPVPPCRCRRADAAVPMPPMARCRRGAPDADADTGTDCV